MSVKAMLINRNKIAKDLDRAFGKMRHPLISAFLAKHKLSQKELATRIGISVTTVERILQLRWHPEVASYPKTNHRIVDKLCLFFKCTYTDLFPENILALIETRLESLGSLNEKNNAEELHDGCISLHRLRTQASALKYVPEYLEEESLDSLDLRRLCHALCSGVVESRERMVIVMLYGLMTRLYARIEVATILDTSEFEVVRIEKTAINKLQKYFSCSGTMRNIIDTEPIAIASSLAAEFLDKTRIIPAGGADEVYKGRNPS